MKVSLGKSKGNSCATFLEKIPSKEWSCLMVHILITELLATSLHLKSEHMLEVFLRHKCNDYTSGASSACAH